jgi:hypothetical protein
MDDLEEILEAVRGGRKSYPNWVALRNMYFRGDSPVQDCEKWAEDNGINVLFRFKEEGLNFRVVEDVMFLPKRSSKK